MTEQTPRLDIGEPLRAALSDHMMVEFGRRPTPDEMWNIYWAAVEAIDEAVAKQKAAPNRIKWVQAESREEQECDSLGWKSIGQETRYDGSLWCLWAEMKGTAVTGE